MSTRHFRNNFIDNIPEDDKLDQKEVTEYVLGLLESCAKNYPPIQDNYDGGLYVGFIGIAYALLHVAQSELLNSKKIQLLSQAKYFVEQDLFFYSQQKRVKDESILSFLLGHIGTLSVAACVYDQLGHTSESVKFANDYISFAERFIPLTVHRSGSDELFVGRAGYLAGIVFLRLYCKQTPINISNEILWRILDSIVTSGQEYSHANHSRSPLMYSYYTTEYLGAGHGLAGILFILMQFKDYLNERPIVVTLIQQSLDYMISVTKRYGGNLPPATDDIGRSSSPDQNLVHWCHGAAGAIYAYARAYHLWSHEKYLLASSECCEVIWCYGLLRKGPGICHGIAGSGYAFLLMYRLTSDKKYFNRARRFFEFIKSEEFIKNARTPDSPFSLFEGWAGTACFVSDLANPEKSCFPFFETFN